MLNSKVAPRRWQAFFDRLSKALWSQRSPKYVRLRRVIPGKVGTYDAAHWLPLVGITYDARDGALYIMLDGLTHRVHQPGEIWASVTADGTYRAFLVLCRDGSKVSVEMSDHQFFSDPSLYRRDPSSRSLQRWKEQTSGMWRGLMQARPRSRRRAPDGSTGKRRRHERKTEHERETEGDEQDQQAYLQAPQPGTRRHDVRHAASGAASRPPGTYGGALPRNDLQQHTRRSMQTTRSVRPPTSGSRLREVHPVPLNDRGGLRWEVHGLSEALTRMQETLRQEQEQIERVLHHPPHGYGRDADRDLLHVQARLDGLQRQAAHTALFVQRLMETSPEMKVSPDTAAHRPPLNWQPRCAV